MLRFFQAGALAAAMLSVNACASKPARSAPPTVTPPVITPVELVPPPVPVVSSWTVPGTLPSTRYVSEVAATLERDSAGRVLVEHVETRGVITLSGRRDTLGGMRATGVVDSFTVRGLDSVLAPANQTDGRTGKAIPVLVATPLSVSFDATLDQRNLRVATRPPLANECDRPETGATNLVRDVIARVPKTLTVGTAWRDSTISFLCRLNVPITSRTRSDYVVERAEQVNERTELIVKRISDTRLDGSLQSTWRTVTLTATGRTTQSLRIDATKGVLLSVDGDGLLTIKLTDSSRRDGSGTQEIRQKTKGRTIVRP